jgi:hypothetical protein
MSYSQALEQQLSLIEFVERHDYALSPEERQQQGVSPDLTAASDAAIRAILKRAEPYYWAPEMAGVIAVTSRDLPTYTLRMQDLPSDFGFCWFARPMPLPHPGRWGGEADMTGFMWGEAKPEGMWFCTLLAGPDRPSGEPSLSGMWSFGVKAEEVIDRQIPALADYDGMADLLRERAAAQVRIIATSLAFMNQRIMVTTPERAERATRKRALAELAREPLVRVVKLRRLAQAGEQRGASEAVEWSCRWVVSGHWRQQFYPSTNEHRPIYVLPYVKGPEDRPLKPPRAKVFAVVR